MKQGIRAINWTIIISMILVLIYLASALYSALELFLFNQSFVFEDLQLQVTDEVLSFSTPFVFYNTGYYDVNQFQVTTILVDEAGEVIEETSTTINDISPGESANLQHSFSLNFSELVFSQRELLFTDSVFNLTMRFNMRYAYALEFGVEMRDSVLPWGAPLSHLNVVPDNPSGNSTHVLLNVTLELENHSQLDLNGSLIFDVFNEYEEYLGRDIEILSLPSMSNVALPLELAVFLEDPGAFTGRGTIIVSLITSLFEQGIEVWGGEYG